MIKDQIKIPLFSLRRKGMTKKQRDGYSYEYKMGKNFPVGKKLG